MPVEEAVAPMEEPVVLMADDEHESLVVSLWVLTLVASWTVVDSLTVR